MQNTLFKFLHKKVQKCLRISFVTTKIVLKLIHHIPKQLKNCLCQWLMLLPNKKSKSVHHVTKRLRSYHQDTMMFTMPWSKDMPLLSPHKWDRYQLAHLLPITILMVFMIPNLHMACTTKTKWHPCTLLNVKFSNNTKVVLNISHRPHLLVMRMLLLLHTKAKWHQKMKLIIMFLNIITNKRLITTIKTLNIILTNPTKLWELSVNSNLILNLELAISFKKMIELVLLEGVLNHKKILGIRASTEWSKRDKLDRMQLTVMTFLCVVIEITLEVKAEVEVLKDIKTRCHMIKLEWFSQISRKSMPLNNTKVSKITLHNQFRFQTWENLSQLCQKLLVAKMFQPAQQHLQLKWENQSTRVFLHFLTLKNKLKDKWINSTTMLSTLATEMLITKSKLHKDSKSLSSLMSRRDRKLFHLKRVRMLKTQPQKILRRLTSTSLKPLLSEDLCDSLGLFI